MARINKLDEEYIKLGRWKCPDSPTGVHHSYEVSREGQYGYFLCKYCLGVQRKPITFVAALKESGVKNIEPSIGYIG